MTLIDDALKAELSELYASPGRHYHGLAHIEALLGLAARHRAELADPDAVEAAIWFHDAVYDSRAKDNEVKSAELAEQRLAGKVAAGRMAVIRGMIEATASHRVPQFADPATRQDAAMFLDMDLSILGAPAPEFDAYERAVCAEYGWVPEDAWRAGRAAILQGFITRQHIFLTETFRTERERQARENIARSLAALKT